MRKDLQRLGKASLTAACIAILWLAVFDLNMLVFAGAHHSERADWIFLPAAFRVLVVLLFAEVGVVGLILGAYLTLPHADPNDTLHEVALAISSGLAPLVGVWSCSRFVHLDANLSGLKPRDIIVLSVATAAANSVILNGYLALAGRLRGDALQIATVFVGDLTGTAIVLFFISMALSLVPLRR